MSEHYYISGHYDQLALGKAILDEAETLHLTKVMRQKVGDEVLLFDGSGREFLARITQIDRQKTQLDILETRQTAKEPKTHLTMAVALPKGERQKWLIEKMTELGVKRFIPLETERSDIKIDQNVIERLKRQVIEASKQCGRLKLMEILPKMTRKEIAERIDFDNDISNERIGQNQLFPPNLLTILSHPIADGQFDQWNFGSFFQKYSQHPDGFPQHILIAIGPVGGFSDSEVQAALDDQWMTLDLGTQVYRVETAAIVAAALFLHWDE
ncbi:MAG: RsmE family RNA methyltransferase [Planctomycetia bacterium]|nr:RsmE family RNA methyltransferase [Planctomycetia bacterium]